MFSESQLAFDDELERHYKQFRNFSSGDELDAFASVLLGDLSYARRLHMPKYNNPVTILRVPQAAVRYAHQLGIPTSKSAHAQRADYFDELARRLDDAWQDLVTRCRSLFGDHGPLVSGIYRDHFPVQAQNRLRFLAHGKTMAGDAARLHRYLSKTRSPLFS